VSPFASDQQFALSASTLPDPTHAMASHTPKLASIGGGVRRWKRPRLSILTVR
jgi:hypothetical protein